MLRLIADQDHPPSTIILAFLDSCGIERPLYSVAITAKGCVFVNHWPAVGDVQELCMHIPEHGPDVELVMLPMVLTVISLDGRSTSARIEVGDGDAPRFVRS